MGHANRSRLNHALGLDAQSRRVRFPSARRCESDTNTNSYSYGYSNRYANSDSDSHSDTNGDSASSNAHAYSDGAAPDNTYTTVASNAAASPVAVVDVRSDPPTPRLRRTSW